MQVLQSMCSTPVSERMGSEVEVLQTESSADEPKGVPIGC